MSIKEESGLGAPEDKQVLSQDAQDQRRRDRQEEAGKAEQLSAEQQGKNYGQRMKAGAAADEMCIRDSP